MLFYPGLPANPRLTTVKYLQNSFLGSANITLIEGGEKQKEKCISSQHGKYIKSHPLGLECRSELD
jgi:hypothetical protein